MLSGLQKWIDGVNATHVIFCADVKPYVRLKQYPEYKAGRVNDEDLVEKKKVTETQFLELCKVMEWPVWGVTGFEYDDLVSVIAIHYRHRFKTITAVSNDSDLFQLFNWNGFQMWRGNKGLYTKAEYSKDWGMSYDDLILSLAIVGTHNSVSGVKGIGEVKVKKLIANPPALRTVLKDHKETIERNLSLIKLPHSEFPMDERMPKITHPFDERKLYRYCGRYDINITKAMLDAFERLGK